MKTNAISRKNKANSESGAGCSKSFTTWLKSDRAALVNGLVASQSAFDISVALDRSVSCVVSQVAAMTVAGDLDGLMGRVGVDSEAVGDFILEASLLAVTGAPLVEVCRWAAGADCRAELDELVAAAPWPAAEQGARLALDMGLWAVLDASPADLVWLASQPVEQLLSPLESLLARLEAATPAMVRKAAEGGLAGLDGPVVFPRATVSATPAGRASWSNPRSGAAPGRRSKRGKARFGSRGRSQSYPSGSPVRDTRSAAEKAWESRTHW